MQSWLQHTDLTSPWSESKERQTTGSKRLSLTTAHKKQLADSTTQTNLSLPVNFNLFEFLEKHGAPLQAVQSSGSTVPHPTDKSGGSSANSSLR